MELGWRTGLARKIMAVALLLSALGVPPAPAAPSDIPNPATWVTNGPVHAIACTPGTVYLGGLFTWVGPATGGGVPLSTATGQAADSFPRVIGSVYACAADGAGGWYIGGDFSQVGTLTRTNIAHILADGRIDPVWSATPNGGVRALAVAGGKVYVGGAFTTINRQTRQYVAALDAASGALTAWNPNATSYVQSLVVVGGTVYAGGYFTEIGGQVRHCLAALDASTGLATAWDPNPSYPVYALAVSGTTVYAGGEFTSIGGQTRNHLAALDASAGLATAWDPNVNNPVYALAVAGGVVYAGGMFTMVGGKTRNYIAALDAASGAATAWNPDASGDVRALVVSGGTVYAGGWFVNIGGQVRRHLAALNASSGAATAWNADANDTALALAVASGTVYAGGKFTSLGGQVRNHLAALDAATGAATAWNPNANGHVYALAVSGGTVYAGGNFSTMDGQSRNYLAAMDAASGAVKPWNPNANGDVYVLAASGAMVYAGGLFTIVGGQQRRALAALDAASGAVTAWKADSNNIVTALAVSGGTVYAGGDFTSVGGLPRIRIAALDAASGGVTSWHPDADGIVETFAVSGGTVYTGGFFSSVGGMARDYLAALDPSTGTASDWNPNANKGIRALAISGGAVYTGGHFTSIGGQMRNYLAALNVVSGAATAWNPDVNESVYAVAVSGGTVYAGGDFTSIGGQPQAYFAQFDTLVTAPPAAPANPGATDVQTDRITWTWTDASDNEDGFKVWANPGTGAPTTLRTTTAADATSWLYSGLSSNAPYTFQVAATNPLGDSARSAACTAWTQIEPISALNFLSVTQTSIAVAPANTPSNLASGFSGIYISNDTAATASGWQQSAAPWVSSSLTPNTQYAFRGRSRNGERVSGANAAASQWTLAAPPIYGINVICDLTTGTVYPLGTAFTFTNPAGSGPGTHGGSPYKVSHFRSAWNESPTYTFTGSESHWSAYLYQTPPSPGSYYLHLQSLNGIGAATAQTLDVGPFIMAAPPKITASPLGQTVNPGARVTFSVTASGTAPLSYQWKKNGVAISGATAASYTINAAADSNEGEYICVVTNRVGSASSAPAVLVVVNPPIISMQSSSQAVDRGAGVTLFVSADGGTPFSYQWRKNGNPIPGATADRYAITAAQPADDADYDCIVSNSAGAATSKVIHLTVNYPPTIIRQPLSQAVNVGARVTFTVAATGTEPLDYMWFKDGTFIPGATSPSYAIAAARESDEGSYHCLVSNATGWEASNPATLTVNIPPTFTLQPLSQSVNPGARVTFSVTASGTAPLGYQWRKDGVNISGAIASSYTIASAAMADAAFYSCVVTSTDGAAISNPARLVVNPTLTVASAYGTPAPFAGAHVYTTGTLISASVSGSPLVDTTGTTRLACTGWSGAGSLAASGTTTQTSFRLGLDSALTWRWQTQYRLDAAATPPGAGRVTLGDGVTNAAGSWHNAATLIGIKAVPNHGYALAGWSGDAGGTATTCPLSMIRPRAVAARFVRAGVLTPDRTGLSFLKGSRWEVDVTHGGVPTTQTLTLTNMGELPISFTGGTAGTPGLALAGRCAGDFSIQGVSPSTSTPLAPGGSVTVTIRFAPQRTQYTLGLDAALVVTSTSPWGPALSIPLLGDAVPVKLSGFKAE